MNDQRGGGTLWTDCLCGCGIKIKNPDSKGIYRKYIKGHHTHTKEFKNKMSERQSGSKNASWKGGRYISKDGYIVLRINGKPAQEHRYFMEQKIGRKLNRNEYVHHINNNKKDNRIENLAIMTDVDHGKHHDKELSEEFKKNRLKNIIEAMHKKRKPRTIIHCACGCGKTFEDLSERGRSRKYIQGHGRKGKSSWDKNVETLCACGCGTKIKKYYFGKERLFVSGHNRRNIKEWDMNKQGRNGITWCDATENPVSGCLKHCDFCFAMKYYKRFGLDFTPQFHPERMKNFDRIAKITNKQRIFVGSVTDMWGKGVELLWMKIIFEKIRTIPQHDFLTLTKMPHKVNGENLPPNLICGITVIGTEPNSYFDQIEYQWERAKRWFISFEPLLGMPKTALLYIKGCEFIIIGSQTKPNVAMDKAWVEAIEHTAFINSVPVHRKKNFLVK